MVMDAWKIFEPITLTNLWNRWRLILDLITEDEGGDRLVERRRRKLFRAPPEDAEDLLTDVAVAEEEGENKADAIAMADNEG